jgi:hypothetical protein
MSNWRADLIPRTEPRLHSTGLTGTCSLLALLCSLACVSNVSAQLAAGMDSDGGELHVLEAAGPGRMFSPFGATFTGGVRVAVGDVNRDGVADIIVGTGPGATARVRVFDGQSLAQTADFEPFGAQFTGGVYVAAGDVNGDGVADIITGAGAGSGPRVRVFDGITQVQLANFLAYEPSFTGGVRVATGDLNNDQRADIITGAGPGGGPHVKVFDGSSGAELHAFMAFEPSFTGGVHVAGGDWDGDGEANLIVARGASTGGGPHVLVFDGYSVIPVAQFFAYDSGFQGGVRVATGDVNGDGRDDIITAPGAGGGPLLKQFLAPNALAGENALAFSPNYLGGVFVASAVRLPIVMRDGFE